MASNSEPSNEAHAQYLARTYLPEIDGLRAISILLVVTTHMKDKIWHWLNGHDGVTVFFVISGYLITMLALREERLKGRLNVPAFFVRRVFRLCPSYYLVLGIYVLLIIVLKQSPEKRDMLKWAMPYYLVYFQEYPKIVGDALHYVNVPYYQTWTLGFEEKFYLVWPFVGFVAWRSSERIRRLGTTILAAFLMATPFLLGAFLGKFFSSYGDIMLGCLIALLLNSSTWFNRLVRLGRPLVVGFALAVFLVAHLSIPHLPTGSGRFFHLFYAITFAFFLVSLLVGDGSVQKFLRLPFLVMIGKLSYGMYLLHILAINIADKIVKSGTGSLSSAVAALFLTYVLTIIAAYVLALTIERPGIAMGRRISSSLQRGKPEVAGHA